MRCTKTLKRANKIIWYLITFTSRFFGFKNTESWVNIGEAGCNIYMCFFLSVFIASLSWRLFFLFCIFKLLFKDDWLLDIDSFGFSFTTLDSLWFPSLALNSFPNGLLLFCSLKVFVLKNFLFDFLSLTLVAFGIFSSLLYWKFS